MTTISQIRDSLEDARRHHCAGDALAAARIALATQRMAAASRSRFADEIAARAHAIAVVALSNASDADHDTRSELGRIKAESQHLHNGFTRA